MLLSYFDDYARKHKLYKDGTWCYEDGLVFVGLENLHSATQDEKWLNHIIRLITPQLLPGFKLAGYSQKEYNIDNILPGRTLLYLHHATGDDRFLCYAHLLAKQLETHPRTQSGIYWHKLRYPWQVWLDGLYMGAPFKVAYGQRTDNPDLVKDALAQVNKALDVMFVPATQLYCHAIDETCVQPWADSITGQSPNAHWARSIGWLAMALVDIAELVGTSEFKPLQQRTVDLLERIAQLRQPSGLWLQVVEQPDLPGNYEESSASAMFVYALMKGRELALFAGETDGLVNTLVNKTMRNIPGVGMQMVDIVHVAGLGKYQNRYRDGTAQYYISEHCVADDPKGVGPLMMVASFDMARNSACNDG